MLQDKGGSQLSDGYGFSWATSHFAHSRTQPRTFRPQPLTILSPGCCSPVAALEAGARDREVAAASWAPRGGGAMSMLPPPASTRQHQEHAELMEYLANAINTSLNSLSVQKLLDLSCPYFACICLPLISLLCLPLLTLAYICFYLTEPCWAWRPLLGLTWPYSVLLGLTRPYSALLGLTGPHWALLGLTALLGLIGPYF